MVLIMLSKEWRDKMIQLKEMNQIEFEKYLDFLIPDYAQDISENFNLTKEIGLEESKLLMKNTFPQGLSTEGQYLYNVYVPALDQEVGVLWFEVKPEINQAYLFHIYIDEAYRGKGYGTNTLAKLHLLAREFGVTSLGLSVFGNNDKAYQLYKRLGYKITSTAMQKSL